MKRKTPLATLFAGLAIVAAAAASVPTFAAGTSSPFDAKLAATTMATTYANAAQVEPNAIAIAGAKADFKTIADVKGLSDPDWKTIAKTRGVLDDGSATLKTALVNDSAQGGGGSGYATTTLAASSGTSTAAPAIGYTAIDLAQLTKPDGSVTRVTT